MLVLATTFVLAAIAKLRNRASFEQVLAAVVGPRPAGPLAFAVPSGELALAVALLTGAQPRAVALLTLAILVAFSGALVRLRAQPRIASCDCFGSTVSDPADGLMRNAALGVVAAVLAIAPHGGAAWSHPLAELVAASTVALGVACAWQLAVALAPARHAEGR